VPALAAAEPTEAQAMNWMLIALIVAGIYAAGTWTGIKWESGQNAIAENARMVNQRATERLRRQNADTAATGHEADKTEIRTEFVTITERVQHEIETERVVYDRTCIAPGGLQQLADAARAAGYTPQPGNPLPAASAAE
jgi:hypothetical protein